MNLVRLLLPACSHVPEPEDAVAPNQPALEDPAPAPTDSEALVLPTGWEARMRERMDGAVDQTWIDEMVKKLNRCARQGGLPTIYK